jgi:RNA polymerase sigma factor (sigma-70 family)
MADEDNDLYEGILHREATALSRALHVYAPRVMGLMWRRVRSYGTMEDLQDLFQEVAIRVWFNVDRYDPARGGTNFSKWVCQQGMGVAGEFARKAQRRERLLSQGFLTVDDESPEEHWGRNIDLERTKARVNQAVLKLSREDRALIELYLDGLTPGEIAVKLGIQSGAVRTRLSRARSRLAGALSSSNPKELQR